MRPTPLILNVDDDEPGRYAVGRTLRQGGFQVLEADTGVRGFNLALTQRPDLILLDIRLPDIDGFEVCRRIRAVPEISGIPIVQMSASYLDTSSLVKGLNGGADAYLVEPTDPSVLLATVNSMLRMKRAEQTVLQAAQRWQSTFEAMGDGIALLDDSGGVIQSNQAFSGIPGIRAVLQAPFLRMGTEQSRVAEEMTLGGRTFVLTLHPISHSSEALTGAVCVAADVTEKKQLEEQLRQSARLESIGVLAGGIAHDFNNLLTGILGNSSLILESLSPTSPDRELVAEIVKASQSAADLTKQILAYSGKGNFFMQALDLEKVALEVRSFVRRLVAPQVELHFQHSPDPACIVGDVSQIRQVLMNLILNAAESFPPNGTGKVTVSTATEHLPAGFFRQDEEFPAGGYVALTVSDTGSGMAPETLDRIFDPFFTTKFTGRGLGLSAVRGIIRGHKGVLRVWSRLGEGTTFRVYLPVASSQPGDPSPVSSTSHPELPIAATVLVIDDEPHIRRFVKLALEKIGMAVLLAADGREGIEIFRERHQEIDVVLLDLAMPVMDGEQAFLQLFAIRPGIPVLLSTGFNQTVAEARFGGKGLAGFLGKPYTAGELVESVRSVLTARVN